MRLRTLAVIAAAVGLGTASPALATGSPSPSGGAAGALQHLIATLGLRPALTGCAVVQLPGSATCNSRMLVRPNGQPFATTGPSGYGPADLQSAYKLAAASSSSGSGQTVAIVDAYDDPNAESDLGAYRSTYGLPTCTTANGCFHKVNQNGAASPLPSADPGWSEEISLDLDAVSAACPDCHILLVEANSPNTPDLTAA